MTLKMIAKGKPWFNKSIKSSMMGSTLFSLIVKSTFKRDRSGVLIKKTLQYRGGPNVAHYNSFN